MHDVQLSSDQIRAITSRCFPRYRCPISLLLRLLGKTLSKVDQRLWCVVFWHVQFDELPSCQYSANTRHRDQVLTCKPFPAENSSSTRRFSSSDRVLTLYDLTRCWEATSSGVKTSAILLYRHLLISLYLAFIPCTQRSISYPSFSIRKMMQSKSCLMMVESS